MTNPELEAAERLLRKQEHEERLVERKEDDASKLQTAAFSGYTPSLDMIQVLSRECFRLRQELAALTARLDE